MFDDNYKGEQDGKQFESGSSLVRVRLVFCEVEALLVQEALRSI
jgi:hypothetical protein